MTAIGGFLPLEAASTVAAEPYHGGTTALASGRACWHAILRHRRPRRVNVPFYVCDAVLEPLTALGTPFEFYAVDDALRPHADLSPPAGELTLVVNYFGLLSPLVEAAASGSQAVVVDDTQAFFRRGRPDRWSFNSARKFFGVPDGGFLYGPVIGLDDLPPSDVDDCDHLVRRRAGDDAAAWELFKRHEARIGIELRTMSATSAQLLATVDMSEAGRRRVANFRALHAALGARNAVGLPLDDVSDAVPMCYPFVAARDVDRSALTRAGVFVPAFWPEIEARTAPGFARERAFARRLLPLPIDHRYGPADMDALARTVLQVLA
jgi:hypothetical protein